MYEKLRIYYSFIMKNLSFFLIEILLWLILHNKNVIKSQFLYKILLRIVVTVTFSITPLFSRFLAWLILHKKVYCGQSLYLHFQLYYLCLIENWKLPMNFTSEITFPLFYYTLNQQSMAIITNEEDVSIEVSLNVS